MWVIKTPKPCRPCPHGVSCPLCNYKRIT
uniref:Uncharacterized protein n=1 Tax=Anguilla anguilla TaxID=7936 RepID=A0A0E9V4Z6_ANGAN